MLQMGVKVISAPVDQWRQAARITGWTFAVCLSLLFGHWTRSEINHFLTQDSRFLLVVPEPGEVSKGILMDGVNHSSRAAIARIFSDDFGRSIYSIPIAERRRRLLAVNWIREAKVARVWPNQLRVEVAERTPVAFLQVPANSDEKEHPAKAENFTLPVITGITAKHKREDRELRVHRLLKLMEEAGDVGSRISEVDVEDPDNLKIMLQMQDRAVTLILGDRHFKHRLNKFFPYFEDVNRKAPDAAAFDLRLEDRITAVRVVSSVQKKAEDIGGH
jgi:cell division protein FtsQ